MWRAAHETSPPWPPVCSAPVRYTAAARHRLRAWCWPPPPLLDRTLAGSIGGTLAERWIFVTNLITILCFAARCQL
ncbi:hypothetical protein DSL92_04145 [Billgrantia gudaonensis]|uniref:Uncharacterized protein n=1 Tax=Billgrantia gudaonensis TaxID=376427 RepID=A0A3S0Q1A9_9GAMM|nr:hypothetical protein DSL92_04145 [Halomonas gudaonensis]